MKHTTVLALVVAAALGASTCAAEDRPSGTKPTATPGGMGMMDMDKQMARMQEQMARIQNTADPKERQKLMHEHMQSMQQGMNMMCGKGGPMMGMMGGGQKGAMGPGMMDGGQMGPGMMGGDPKQQQEMMGRRIDMMQMMMEQMTEHRQMMQPAPAK